MKRNFLLLICFVRTLALPLMVTELKCLESPLSWAASSPPAIYLGNKLREQHYSIYNQIKMVNLNFKFNLNYKVF